MTKKVDLNVGQNLVTSWRNIATQNGRRTLAEALDTLNQDLGTKTKHDRITAWESGKRSPSPEVINYMLRVVLQSSLRDHGLSPDQIDLIFKRIQIA